MKTLLVFFTSLNRCSNIYPDWGADDLDGLLSGGVVNNFSILVQNKLPQLNIGKLKYSVDFSHPLNVDFRAVNQSGDEYNIRVPYSSIQSAILKGAERELLDCIIDRFKCKLQTSI